MLFIHETIFKPAQNKQIRKQDEVTQIQFRFIYLVNKIKTFK